MAEREGYKYVTPNLAKLIMRIRLKDVALTKALGSMPPELYVSVDRYYKEIDYWIVYHSMKDFQPDDFKVEDVRKMRYVHDIALRILNLSSATDREIVEVINSIDGKRFAKVVFNFNVPIIDEAWKITPLQYRFYELVSNGVDKIYTPEEFEEKVHGSKIPDALRKLIGRELNERQ